MQDSNESRPSRVRLLKGILPIHRAAAMRDIFAGISLASIGVLFGRVNRYLHADMVRHRITEIVGASCIFPTLHQALEAAGVTPAQQEPGVV